MKPNLPKHILVIRLSAMGDVAMMVPVIRALLKQYPDVKITILTRAFFKPFFRGLGSVQVYEADVKGKHKGVLGLYKLSKELKGLQIDAVADLHNVLRSKILRTFLAKYPFVQIDKGRKEKKVLVSGGIFKQLKSTHQRYAGVFVKLGFSVNFTNPTFPEKTVLSNKIEELLKSDLDVKIGIAPFAAHESKMYPFDLMKEVILELSKKHQIILFGGGKKEIKILEGLASESKNVASVAGKLSLNEELDVISNLDVMVSMDSGNGHMAAMLGVKVVTIWGVTHPYAGFAPFNQPEDYALLADRNQFPKIPTSIYGNKYPEGYEDAAGSISPETVVKKIKEVLL